MQIRLITRCTRPSNLNRLYKSIIDNQVDSIFWTWTILFDIYRIESLPSNIIREINTYKNTEYIISESKHDHFCDLVNQILPEIESDEFIFLLDDDTILHEEFFKTIKEHKTPDIKLYLFNQQRWDWVATIDKTRLENIDCVGMIDAGQFLVQAREIIQNNLIFEGGYFSDGLIVNSLLKVVPINNTKIIEKTISYYNWIEDFSTSSRPKILLKNKYLCNDDRNEYVTTLSNDGTLINKLSPDLVITDEIFDPTKADNIYMNFTTDKEHIYNTAVFRSLSRSHPIISFFTSVYNIGSKIIETYQSLYHQTIQNWEWIIVNDSNDGGVTQRILEYISLSDSRVKIYQFTNITKGNIGEAKYRAAKLCNGELLAELDHDDLLTENCIDILLQAYKAHPDCGFFYSDAVEINSKGEYLKYPDGFAMGYGSYYKHTYRGIEYEVSRTPDINPLTIRHIVGVPNHIRVWKKEIYNKLNGHNRRMRIADDYELLVRTFLTTKLCKIPTMLYIQRFHENNSQDNGNRADIQTRVRLITWYYNRGIKERFEQLGMEDWGYTDDINQLLYIPVRPDTQIANETFNL